MNEPHRMDRREALKWILAASASVSLLDLQGLGACARANVGIGANAVTGYGTDPNLMKAYESGAFWPLTFTQEQRRAAAALCDVIIPADDQSPAASSVGVPDFLDEWISAPYPEQVADRKIVLRGLAWLDDESQTRFQARFADLAEGPQRQICDDICYEPNATPEFKSAASFFARFRNLTAGAFYTTTAGMKDIQYVGNVALTQFDGPPPEVLAHLRLG